MRDTGRIKKLKEKNCRISVRFRLEKPRRHDEFQVVNGDLVVEIKSGRIAKLLSKRALKDGGGMEAFCSVLMSFSLIGSFVYLRMLRRARWA